LAKGEEGTLMTLIWLISADQSFLISVNQPNQRHQRAIPASL